MLTQLAGDTLALLANNWFLLAILALIFWVVDKHIGFRMLVVFALTLYVHGLIAFTLAPDTSSLSQQGFNFPAGSVQITTAVWGYLVPEIRDRRFTLIAIGVILLTSFLSYYYTGHSLQDIAAALFIGLFILYVVYRSLDWIGSVPEPIIFSFSLVLPSAMLLIYPEGAPHAGLLLGVGAGHSMEQLKVRMITAEKEIKRAFSGLLGVVGLLFIIYIGGLLPETLVIHFLYTGFLGLWITILQPLLASKMGLCEQEGHSRV
ncbi:phosphatase PAP2 family protein [Alteribacillus iranensis]|uniref:PAP2 superfamily protein n=1 Tax=Alteribacillus iranensis TaxID=930128 RepID=A0A1I1ZJL7_9BACI|nr:phosphatase PAP2 family protein [Alteribacillus iranensis]SFE30743.1 PAP2 superfamily protein [Alteribacillus iranensis]